MARLGWVPQGTPPAERAEALLRFFGVASAQAWTEIWQARAVAFRRSVTRKGGQAAIAAWLRQGETEASMLECAAFERGRFRKALDEARRLTREDPSVFQPRLTAMFAAAGVALVWVPELKGAPVSGATRWLSDHRALIQLSLRYKCDDQLFFSLFHEAGHVLLHPKKAAFLEGVGEDSPEEREADAFAADHLIPPGEYRALLAEALSITGLVAFAERLEIAPGIVVGRLQHDGHLPFHRGNGLKRRLVWARDRSVPTT